MRVLRRDPQTGTDATDEASGAPVDEEGTDAPETEQPTRRWGLHRPAVTGGPAAATATTAPSPSVTTTTTTTEVRPAPWSIADVVVAVVGAGLAAVGAVVLVRTGVDRSWFTPVVNILHFRHTALLGAVELGAGALLMLVAVLRWRVLEALLGLAGAVAATVAAVQVHSVKEQLAIERSWAIILAGVGLFVAVVVLIAPRRRRIERSVQS
jgi:hypothetical protein